MIECNVFSFTKADDYLPYCQQRSFRNLAFWKVRQVSDVEMTQSND